MQIIRRNFLQAALAISAALGSRLLSNVQQTQEKEKKMPTVQLQKETTNEDLYAAMKGAYAQYEGITTYTDSKGEEVEGWTAGKYIKARENVDPNEFGIAAVAPDGEILEVGDTKKTVIMTSAIKPFVRLYTLATRGKDFMDQHINVEAAGQPFNTIDLHPDGRAPNPMINSGALCGCSHFPGDDSQEMIAGFRKFFDKLSSTGEGFELDMDVAMGEIINGKRNHTIVAVLNEANHLGCTSREALEVYYALNFIEATPVDMAVMAATLNDGGINPVTNVDVFEGMGLSENEIDNLVGDLQAMMVTAGMYDAAGKWAQEVGVAAKSCVDGAIFLWERDVALALLGRRLDAEGNSLQGGLATRHIVEALDLNPHKRHIALRRAAALKRRAGVVPDGPEAGKGADSDLKREFGM